MKYVVQYAELSKFHLVSEIENIKNNCKTGSLNLLAEKRMQK